MPKKTNNDCIAELAALPSLGDTSARALLEIGIDSAVSLRAQGSVSTFTALRLRFGRRITINWIYALECAIQGIDWRLLDAERKRELKQLAAAAIERIANH